MVLRYSVGLPNLYRFKIYIIRLTAYARAESRSSGKWDDFYFWSGGQEETKQAACSEEEEE